MKFLRSGGFLLAAAFLMATGSPALRAQAGQDMKAAGHDTKDAAVETGHATKVGAKKTAHGTKKVATKTAHGTKKVATKTVHGTENLGDKIAGKPATH